MNEKRHRHKLWLQQQQTAKSELSDSDKAALLSAINLLKRSAENIAKISIRQTIIADLRKIERGMTYGKPEFLDKKLDTIRSKIAAAR
ncbi:MAG: hypothetical protein LBO08_03405 [Rickettsiales bacterium]|jgi:hypothetical protein|nr:hypothetical protein [Rickettsiales bacterium]